MGGAPPSLLSVVVPLVSFLRSGARGCSCSSLTPLWRAALALAPAGEDHTTSASKHRAPMSSDSDDAGIAPIARRSLTSGRTSAASAAGVVAPSSPSAAGATALSGGPTPVRHGSAAAASPVVGSSSSRRVSMTPPAVVPPPAGRSSSRFSQPATAATSAPAGPKAEPAGWFNIQVGRIKYARASRSAFATELQQQVGASPGVGSTSPVGGQLLAAYENSVVMGTSDLQETGMHAGQLAWMRARQTAPTTPTAPTVPPVSGARRSPSADWPIGR